MDSPRPLTIPDYCSAFGFAISEVKIPCLFCNYYMSLQDVGNFDLKGLQLVWKTDYCYGVCTPCLRATAKYEEENYHQCSVGPLWVETLAEKSLLSLCIRCLLCLKLLDCAEKYQHIPLREPFHLVRGQWRGYCRWCIRKE
ncbi:E6 [Macaca mulatta papillomavirus 4]|uniref:Protein E6 n=1 Tax=Macaca mulatta papillomavirus 4 TaxID=2294152 RepID=A0A385AH15_9PAPI|nr:E6 [Macaca mulatta papillomavirus 4]AXN57294.1 E6 [Macaca mulatta papillomavirus 4]